MKINLKMKQSEWDVIEELAKAADESIERYIETIFDNASLDRLLFW